MSQRQKITYKKGDTNWYVFFSSYRETAKSKAKNREFSTWEQVKINTGKHTISLMGHIVDPYSKLRPDRLCNFEFTGLFTNIISNLWEIWLFCNGYIRYYMVGPTRNFEVMDLFNHLISNTAIPYSILDGPPLCKFKVTIYCSHLVSNIRFTHFLYSILDAYRACIRSQGYLRHLISNMWFTEVPIFDIRQ